MNLFLGNFLNNPFVVGTILMTCIFLGGLTIIGFINFLDLINNNTLKEILSKIKNVRHK